MLIMDSEAGHIDQIMCVSSNFELVINLCDVHTGTEIL